MLPCSRPRPATDRSGLAEPALVGFLRVVTHPAIFDPPSRLDAALAFVERLRERPNAIPVRPGLRHWEVFARLLRSSDARGNRVPDAHLAALAVEAGAELLTADRGFARFPGLRWTSPLPDGG